MKNPLLILKILDLLNGFLLLAFLFKLMHWPFLPFKYSIVHIIFGALVVYAIKSWVEIKYDLPNLIKSNKLTNMLFYIGNALFILGVVFKLMHWPFESVLVIVGVSTVIITYIISFFINPGIEEEDSEIIDNFNHE